MRWHSLFLLLIFLLLAPGALRLVERTSSEEPFRPFRPYESIPLNLLMYPRIGAPAVVSDGSFTAWIKHDPGRYSLRPEEIAWHVKLDSVFEPVGPFELGVVSWPYDTETGSWELSLEVPPSVPRGLYNLTIFTDGIEETEPNSVYVIGSDPIEGLQVAVISDSHFGIREFYKPKVETLTSILDALDAIGPDLIVTAGDNIDGTADEAVYLAYYELIIGLRVPILITPGNNDHFTYDAGFLFFEKYLGPHYKSINYGPYHFVSMDTDTGKIDWPLDDPYLGGGQLEWVQEDVSRHADSFARTLVFHHPYWPGEEELTGGERIPEIIETGGVDVVLIGHRHLDKVLVPPEVPTLTMITTSSGGTSSQHEGFRLLAFEGSEIHYEEFSIDWQSLAVRYMQDNDGSSYGMAVRVTNAEPSAYQLRLTAFLDSSQGSLTVENAELLRELQVSSSLSVVEARILAQPGSETTVKISYLGDADPPTMTITPEVKDTEVELLFETSDLGLGVLESMLFYSEDNSSWVDIEPTVVDKIPHWRFEATSRTMYYRGEVTDVAGLRTEVFGSVEIPSIEPPPEEAPALPVELILGATGLAVVLLFIFLLMRRRSRS
ncbi:MAG: metallophosphoesterase family protein [Candidatus Geothermarchaeales archaeon]